jgi:hypothetical protein
VLVLLWELEVFIVVLLSTTVSFVGWWCCCERFHLGAFCWFDVDMVL